MFKGTETFTWSESIRGMFSRYPLSFSLTNSENNRSRGRTLSVWLLVLAANRQFPHGDVRVYDHWSGWREVSPISSV